MITREIRLDDPLGARLGLAGGRMPGLPGLGAPLAQEVANGLRIDLVLAAEMAIEAAVRQARARHDLLDRNLGEPLAVEQPSGAFEDPFPRILLALLGIGHLSSSRGSQRDEERKMILHIPSRLLRGVENRPGG